MGNRPEYMRKWRENHPGYDEARKEKRRITTRLWYFRNPEKVRELNRKTREKYKLEKPEYFKLKMRERVKKRRLHIRLLEKLWRDKNPEKIRAKNRNTVLSGKNADYQGKRRFRLQSGTSENCEWKIQFLRLLPFCSYCFEYIQGKVSIDHIIPLVRGGTHTRKNLSGICRRCNSSKNTKLPSEWINRPCSIYLTS